MIPSSYYTAIQRKRIIHGPSRWITGTALTCAAATAALAGCSPAPHNAAAPDTPAMRALRLAATTSEQVNSLAAKLVVHSAGTTSGGLTGTISIQLKPTRVIAAVFHIASSENAPSVRLDEILTGQAIYFKDPAFTKSTGKPWIKVTISQLSSKAGITFASLLQNLEGSNPLDQTRLFTASTDVRVVGSRTVNGVATTEYAGSYAPAMAYAQLSPRLRELLGPALRSIGTNVVHFHIWVDAQHLIRKADDSESVRGQTITTSFDVTSINQPVRVTLPAQHDTAPLPKI